MLLALIVILTGLSSSAAFALGFVDSVPDQYDPVKDYYDALREAHSYNGHPLHIRYQVTDKVRHTHIVFKPINWDDTHQVTVAILYDDNKDGVIDRYKDFTGVHEAAKRPDFITPEGQLTPYAARQLEEDGERTLNYGIGYALNAAALSVTDTILFTSRHLHTIYDRVQAEKELVREARQELEVFDPGSPEWIHFNAMVAQHEEAIDHYLHTTAVWTTGGLVALDVILLVPGAFGKVSGALVKLSDVAGIGVINGLRFWLKESINARKAVVSSKLLYKKMAGTMPAEVVKASTVAAGKGIQRVLSSRTILTSQLSKIRFIKALFQKAKMLERILPEAEYPIGKLFASEAEELAFKESFKAAQRAALRKFIKRQLYWAVGSGVLSEAMSRGSDFFTEFDEVLSNLGTNVTFSVLTAPLSLRRNDPNKVLMKLFISFMYAGTDAAFSNLRLEGDVVPSTREQWQYLFKRETQSVLWGSTISMNTSMANDTASIHFAQMRAQQPQKQAAIEVAEFIYRATTKIFNLYISRVAQRQTLGYRSNNPEEQKQREAQKKKAKVF